MNINAALTASLLVPLSGCIISSYNYSTMNHSQRQDQSRVYSHGSANDSSITWEADINRDARYQVSENKSGPTSQSNIREGNFDYPTPNTLKIIGDDPPFFHSTTNHRGCGQTLYSWFPEFICCILGILALTGEPHALCSPSAYSEADCPSGCPDPWHGR